MHSTCEVVPIKLGCNHSDCAILRCYLQTLARIGQGKYFLTFVNVIVFLLSLQPNRLIWLSVVLHRCFKMRVNN